MTHTSQTPDDKSEHMKWTPNKSLLVLILVVEISRNTFALTMDAVVIFPLPFRAVNIVLHIILKRQIHIFEGPMLTFIDLVQ